MYESNLSTKLPGDIKLVFAPNVGQDMQSYYQFALKFAGVLILDERLLLNHNIIEYRYKTYEVIAEAIAHKFVGEKIIESSYSDYWLFCGLRGCLAKQYKIKRCGAKIDRYQLMRQMAKYIKYAKLGQIHYLYIQTLIQIQRIYYPIRL